MNWKAIFKTAGHAALGGLVVGLAAFDPSQPITAHTVLIPAAASAATSVISLYSDNPLAQSIIGVMKAVITAKSGTKSE